jgi:hypothetical protein
VRHSQGGVVFVAFISPSHCVFRSSDAVATNLVLGKHDANGSVRYGNAPLLKQRKEDLLLLAVMTMVGELSQEVNRLNCKFFRYFPPFAQPLDGGLQHRQDALNDIVLFFQYSRGLHAWA